MIKETLEDAHILSEAVMLTKYDQSLQYYKKGEMKTEMQD